jgi:formate-dependent nitrite reductase membrane component NrfD
MAETPTYYDRPALKASDWRWLIISYLFVGGMAGASQVIAGVVDLVGDPRDRRLVSAGRYLALFGSLLSPALLIADLKTPSRWYNMLRIVRGTSPMSIGSWTLLAFGSLSGLAALAQLAADVRRWRAARRVARLIGVPAALTGGLLATYTGALLSATSTPLWAASYRLLPAVFGLSGTSTATAALGFFVRRRTALDRLALVVSAFELALALRLDALWKREGVSGPLEETRLAVPYRLGALGLGMVAPLAIHALQAVTGRELRTASNLAAVAALCGGFLQRAALILAGKGSAERPADYFRMAR